MFMICMGVAHFCALIILPLCRIDKKLGFAHQPRSVKERFRPMPLCSPILLPTPHALVTTNLYICFPSIELY